jgi:Protein of unknown function DUF262
LKTSPTSLKIRQVVRGLKDGTLVPRPEFQRRIVWTTDDKVRFVDTLLNAYPFPEIYVANGVVNTETGEGTQLIVDGQQRVTTIVQYFDGSLLLPQTVRPYALLTKEEKDEFLNYDVAVRDLGSISPEDIIEVFKRINATKYSLNEIEINNAIYTGELMRLAEGLTSHPFFDEHRVFTPTDLKRMGDTRFILQVIITMLSGYFNRDDSFEEFLGAYNDSFEARNEIVARLTRVFNFVEECGFPAKGRIWKKSDFFTALIELDRAFSDNVDLQPTNVLETLQGFYRLVEAEGMESGDPAVATYYKAAVQASNDKGNRIRRGEIINDLLRGVPPIARLI